jgi:hypothetical protein
MSEETVQAVSNAVGEGSKTLGKIIDAGGKLAQYFDGMLRERGGIAEDNMKLRRLENRLKLYDKAEKLLRERGLDGPTREVPVKFALPLVAYATLEEDEELQDIWAQMLANAADGSSRVELRTAYIDILKDLTAFDVKNLSQLAKLSMSDLPQEIPLLIRTSKLPDSAEVFTTSSGVPERPSDEVLLSLSNLSRAGCVSPTYGFGGMPIYSQVAVMTIGMELYRACTKPRN